MAEYIEREALLQKIRPPQDDDGRCAVLMSDARKILREFALSIPTADVEPVRHGRWVNKQEKDTFAGYLTRFVCSECGRVEQAKEPYCHCGAKMDATDINVGDKEGEDET